MRDGPGETAIAIPLVVRIDVARVQPPTMVVAVRGQEARAAVRIENGRMHDDDVPQTEGFDFLVREVVADKAADLGVRIGEVLTRSKYPGFGILTHTLRDPIYIRPEFGRQDRDFVYDACGRLEFFGAKDTLGVVAQVVALLLKVSDPFFPCPTSGWRQGEVDHAILGDCPLRFETLLVILN